jgi:hypothetical protein
MVSQTPATDLGKTYAEFTLFYNCTRLQKLLLSANDHFVLQCLFRNNSGTTAQWHSTAFPLLLFLLILYLRFLALTSSASPANH